MFKRKERTKVYAGRRKTNTGLNEVPTLTQICQRYLQEHIDRKLNFNSLFFIYLELDELGDLPYTLLACVFERCNTEQLDRISAKNPVILLQSLLGY
jgi:hypothetical protein